MARPGHRPSGLRGVRDVPLRSWNVDASPAADGCDPRPGDTGGSGGRRIGAWRRSSRPAARAPILRGALPEAPAGYDWSGVRLTLETGFLRGEKQTLRLVGANPQEQGLIDLGGLGTVAMARSGFAAGGGLGYDRQLAPGSGLVLGAVADLRTADLDRFRQASVAAGGNTCTLSARQSLDMLGSVRGRLGYAFDRVLVYGTAGLAFGHAACAGKTDVTAPLGTGPLDAGAARGWEAGLVYGGGVEGRGAAAAAAGLPERGRPQPQDRVPALRPRHAQRRDLRHRPVYGPGGSQPLGHTATARFRSEGQLVGAGLSYRFGASGF